MINLPHKHCYDCSQNNYYKYHHDINCCCDYAIKHYSDIEWKAWKINDITIPVEHFNEILRLYRLIKSNSLNRISQLPEIVKKLPIKAQLVFFGAAKQSENIATNIWDLYEWCWEAVLHYFKPEKLFKGDPL